LEEAKEMIKAQAQGRALDPAEVDKMAEKVEVLKMAQEDSGLKPKQ
jgi:hypothetical protein